MNMKKTVLILVAVILVAGSVTGASAQKSNDSERGSLTWYNTNSHGAATHHGDSQLTFVQGATLKLTKGSKSTWVKVNDVCDGDACQDLDVDPSTFTRLGASSSAGVITVTIECGKDGTRPMRKCLAGEG